MLCQFRLDAAVRIVGACLPAGTHNHPLHPICVDLVISHQIVLVEYCQVDLFPHGQQDMIEPSALMGSVILGCHCQQPYSIPAKHRQLQRLLQRIYHPAAVQCAVPDPDPHLAPHIGHYSYAQAKDLVLAQTAVGDHIIAGGNDKVHNILVCGFLADGHHSLVQHLCIQGGQTHADIALGDGCAQGELVGGVDADEDLSSAFLELIQLYRSLAQLLQYALGDHFICNDGNSCTGQLQLGGNVHPGNCAVFVYDPQNLKPILSLEVKFTDTSLFHVLHRLVI